MATPNPIFQYWNGTTWVEAKTHAGNSAVVLASITKVLNNPSTAELILSNRPKDLSATDNDARGLLSDHTGDRATVFTEFQDGRIIDNESGLVIFRGRIYHIRNQYDFQYGNTVKLVLKDMIQELADIPIDDAPPALQKIDVSTYNSRSKVIARVISKLSDNFDVSDDTSTNGTSAKFEDSAYVFSAFEQATPGGGNNYDILSGQQQALQIINDFAKQDPHDSNTDSNHFGYDYHVDANVVSSALTTSGGAVSLNYFKRGSRPASVITTHGVTLEYPSSDWGGQNNFRKAMLSDSEFTNPDGAFFTSVVVHFEDKGEGDDAKTIHGVGTFELIKGTVTGNFPWEELRIQYIEDGDKVAGNSTRRNTTTGQSLNTKNPRLLYDSGQTVPCATVHFQSGTGTDKFLILSNVYESDETWIDPHGNSISFKTFPANPTQTVAEYAASPATGGKWRLHLAPSQAITGTTYPYIDIYRDARVTDAFGINKPYREHIRNLDSYDAVRKGIAGVLDRASRTSITIGKARTSRYPYTKVIARKSVGVDRSGNVITLTADALANSAGANAGRDISTFGAKRGMVIAQLTKTDGSNSAIVRYAYISAITSTTITYGTGENDTSDGTPLSDT